MDFQQGEPANIRDEERAHTARAAVAPDCMQKLPQETPGRQALVDEQWHAAKSALIDKDFVNLKFPRTMRLHIDPPLNGQTFALVSFIPSAGAKPDEQGCFGVFKVRGTFESETRADSVAEVLIRSHDSYAVINYCYVGRPFPLMLDNTMYTAATREIDIRKKVDDIMRADLKKKREQEQLEMQDIQNRQRALMSDVEEEKNRSIDDLELYTQLRVKHAHLLFTRDEATRKRTEAENLASKAYDEIVDMDKLHPEYRKLYKERYMAALDSSGIDKAKNPLLKYLE